VEGRIIGEEERERRSRDKKGRGGTCWKHWRRRDSIYLMAGKGMKRGSGHM